ncbi:MAG: twin-arginine translocation pathway signal protein, partial [Pseudomonadota bacterium]
PWMVALDGTDSLTLFFDTDRQLPATDPFDRQLTIGLGCFLELLEMAANADGYAVERVLFPEGEPVDGLDKRPIARMTLRQADDAVADPLWQYVPSRRSLKEPFDTSRPVPSDALAALVAAGRNNTQIGGTVDMAAVARWRDVTEQALRLEIETPHTYHESVDLFRIGKAEVTANPDGIDFHGPLFETLRLLGQFNREVAVDRSTAAYAQGFDAVLENARTAMGHVWMITPGNSRADQIAAGADWLRVNLAATAQGLGFQPLSQALQEYPEMAAHYKSVHDSLALEGGTVQMLARIGYGPDVPVSPRWPIEAKMVDV